MEVLTQLLHRASAVGDLSFHLQVCQAQVVPSYSFVDDLLLFSEASSRSLQGIKQVMADFESLSGLGVSYTKSEIFRSGISEELKAHLAAIMGMKLGSLLVRYLGVPLLSGKQTIKDYTSIIDKITARIKAWTSKFLSFAGRLQLIHLVLTSLYQYWCNVFLLPNKLTKAIEQLCSAFL